MPFEQTLVRGSLTGRARRAREHGVVQENRFPLRSQQPGEWSTRDEAHFEDITGKTIIGFAVIGTMKT